MGNVIPVGSCRAALNDLHDFKHKSPTVPLGPLFASALCGPPCLAPRFLPPRQSQDWIASVSTHRYHSGTENPRVHWSCSTWALTQSPHHAAARHLFTQQQLQQPLGSRCRSALGVRIAARAGRGHAVLPELSPSSEAVRRPCSNAIRQLGCRHPGEPRTHGPPATQAAVQWRVHIQQPSCGRRRSGYLLAPSLATALPASPQERVVRVHCCCRRFRSARNPASGEPAARARSRP